MKVLIHRDHGGFHFSDAELEAIAERKGWFFQTLRDPKWERSYALASDKPLASIEEWSAAKNNGITVVSTYSRDLHHRTDPEIIAVIEENQSRSALEIVEIPDDVEWDVAEYDGAEWIAEKHRTW